jgi:uncharacterized membrane protein YczE
MKRTITGMLIMAMGVGLIITAGLGVFPNTNGAVAIGVAGFILCIGAFDIIYDDKCLK